MDQTPREKTCFAVIGLLGVTLYRDRLDTHKTLQGFFSRQLDTERAVMDSLRNAYHESVSSPEAREAGVTQASALTDVRHVHELPAAVLGLSLLEEALNPVVDVLQEQLLEEGYDATDQATLLRVHHS